MANGEGVELYLDPPALAGLDAHASMHGLSRSALMRIVLRDAAKVIACPLCFFSGKKPGEPL